MERQTVLILDSQLHRGGILEQGLNSRGFNVFRTSRSREAAKLMQVLQPDMLILSWEGEGIKFYQERILTDPQLTTRCVLLASGSVSVQRPADAAVNMNLSGNELIDAVASAMAQLLSGGAAEMPVNQKTNPSLSPMDADFLTQRVTPPPRPSFPLTPLPQARNPASLTPSPAAASPTQERNVTEAYPAFTGNHNRKREWKGSLDKLDIARLFSILMRRQATGELALTLQGETRIIWLQNGTLLSAESNLPLLQMPELLVQDGVIQHHHVQQHPELARPKPGLRLLELGLIQQSQVEAYNRLYVEQVAEASFLWEFGTFVFTPNDNATHLSEGFELSPLIIQGVREGYSRERLVQLLGGEERIPQWFAQRSPEDFLPLNSMEKNVISQIDGTRSLEELWVALQLDPRVPYGLIYVLMILGYVTLQEPAVVRPTTRGSSESFVSAPSSPLRDTAGDATPSVPLHSTRAMYDPAKQAPTPHSMPSLPHTENQELARQPSVSYRVMPNARNPVRPVLQTTMDLPPLPMETRSSIGASTPDPALLQSITDKHQIVLCEDYFNILEIDQQAGDMEIRRAYQRLKHLFSNEQFQGDFQASTTIQLEEIQQTIQEAYDVLGDPTLRELYRQNLDAP